MQTMIVNCTNGVEYTHLRRSVRKIIFRISQIFVLVNILIKYCIRTFKKNEKERIRLYYARFFFNDNAL